MKNNRNHSKWQKIIGWLLFLAALSLFFLQMGYTLFHSRFRVEYSDNRFFFVINILIVLFLAVALMMLLSLSKRSKIVISSLAVVFILINGVLIPKNNEKIKNITSLSPNFKHVLSIKVDPETGQAVYYRTYYWILARAKEVLPYGTTGEFKVEWLAKDIAAVTYKATDDKIHQYIGTYGDRGGGTSYYYVGAEIHGRWQGENVEILSGPEGISIGHNDKQEHYEWENTVQFGTLALVLTENNEAKWTIALGEDIKIDSNSYEPHSGEIILYKATMQDTKPIRLHQ